MSSILGLTITFWAVYSTNVDLPSFLERLVGLGYAVGRAYTIPGGDYYIEYLGDGSLARKNTNEGPIRILYDSGRKALGVIAPNRDLSVVGLAEFYRALSEAKIPEPPITELFISYTDNIQICPNRSLRYMNMELSERGTTLLWGEPQGKSMYVMITPVSNDRSLVMIGARGEWGFTIGILRNINELFLEVKKLNCSSGR